MPAEERAGQQWHLLKDVVANAWHNCPYYREKYAAVGFSPEELRNWDDLKHLPPLTKQEIVQNAAGMISAKANRNRFISRKTSGSTGVSLRFVVDDAEFQFKRGVTLYRDQWSGWRPGDWRAMVWGNPTYLYSMRGRFRNRFLERAFSLDTLKMDERMMSQFAREILHRKPTLLFGHAHSLYLFACYWQDMRFPEYRFKGIISTAMVLHAHERAQCESVFGARIFDRYGCEEVSLIATECEAHDGLHINTDSLVLEILGGRTPVSSGDPGAVVVTDLRNFAMPFIRYEVGDTARQMTGDCSCGRTYPRLGQICGRIADYLRTPEGYWVSGISLTENFATLIPGIHQIQIIQEQSDFVRLRIARGPEFGDESLRLIREMTAERFGPRMRYCIEHVDRISPEPSGKYRFSIYKVPT